MSADMAGRQLGWVAQASPMDVGRVKTPVEALLFTDNLARSIHAYDTEQPDRADALGRAKAHIAITLGDEVDLGPWDAAHSALDLEARLAQLGLGGALKEEFQAFLDGSLDYALEDDRDSTDRAEAMRTELTAQGIGMKTLAATHALIKEAGEPLLL